MKKTSVPTVKELRENNSPRQLAQKLRKALLQVQDCNSDLQACKTDLSQTSANLKAMTEDDQRQLLAKQEAQAALAKCQKELADCKAHNPQAGRPWAYIPQDGE